MKCQFQTVLVFGVLAVAGLPVWGQTYGAQFATGAQFAAGVEWPEEVFCGEEFTVDVPVRNTLREPWRETEFVKLGPIMGAEELFRPDGHKFKMPDLTEVQPGESFTFTLELTAPEEAGTHVTRWSMMKGGVPFGPRMSRWIMVRCGDNASLGAVTFPDRVSCGETFSVPVEMKNTGNTAWTDEEFFKLGSEMGPKDIFRKDGQRFKMPRGTRVEPGESHVFEVELTAPDEPGTYDTSWLMMKAGNAFGESAEGKIRVRCRE